MLNLPQTQSTKALVMADDFQIAFIYKNVSVVYSSSLIYEVTYKIRFCSETLKQLKGKSVQMSLKNTMRTLNLHNQRFKQSHFQF